MAVKVGKDGYPQEWDDEYTEETLIDGTEKPNFWKPEKKGDTVRGELLSIIQTKFGKVLKIDTPEGIINVPVTTTLADIKFDKYVGSMISFTYAGTTGERNCRLFTVKVLKPKA